jgi:hypothetical protein
MTNIQTLRLHATASIGGVQIVVGDRATARQQQTLAGALADALALTDCLQIDCFESRGVHTVWLRLHPDARRAWLPEFDTAALHRHLGHAIQEDEPRAIEREILVGLLAAPLPHVFADVTGLASAVRVRRHMTLAARRTALAFKTSAAERPEDFWHYDEDYGFILHPGVDLIDALVAATQPEATGRVYDFSCYRASEYVILLGLARELREHDPMQYESIRQRNERHAIRSGLFHEVYLVEYGLERPLPMRYYVPGDRLWFRNPDARSSDASGYEGSWVMYMGGGLFSNFWVRNKPFTLEAKCLEMYHWRDAVYIDDEGEPRIDERQVEALVSETWANPEANRSILGQMMRYRDPAGVYALGGCIDTTREFPRTAIGQGAEIVLPPIPV